MTSALWLQLILISIGTAFQVAAICHARQPKTAIRLPVLPDKIQAGDIPRKDVQPTESLETFEVPHLLVAPTAPTLPRGSSRNGEAVPPTPKVRPALLMKTEKVFFIR
jgi:hypothetical protein